MCITNSSRSRSTSPGTSNDKSMKGDTTAENIPFLANTWRKTCGLVPEVYFPGTNISISFSLVSAAFLIAVRILGRKLVLEQFFGWPNLGNDNGDATEEAAACISSITHSTLLCPGLIIAFLTHRYNPSEHISQAPKWWQELVNALLQFCTGYMIYDAIFICWLRWQWMSLPAFTFDDGLFLVHHFMTTTYMTQARWYQAGHMSAMMCMLIGEASNPLHNAFMMSSKAIELDCCNGSTAQFLHTNIQIAFSIVYLLLRTLIGPIICLHMSWDLLFSKNARDHLPLRIRLFWNFMIWAVILGSYSWIVYCYTMLQNNNIIPGKVDMDETKQEL